MTNANYSLEPETELPQERSGEPPLKTALDDAHALPGHIQVGGCREILLLDGSPDQMRAEPLIGQLEAAGSSCVARSVAQDDLGAVRDPGCMLPKAAEGQAPGQGGSLDQTSENPGNRQQWVLPALLALLAICLGIFFLVNYTDIGKFRRDAGGADVSATASRVAIALHRGTRSKLAELNQQVVLWLTRYAEDLDPRRVTLKRVREDLNLSSDQMLDGWGRLIKYEAVEAGFILRSSGPDKKFNTGDDLVELQPLLPSRVPPQRTEGAQSSLNLKGFRIRG